MVNKNSKIAIWAPVVVALLFVAGIYLGKILYSDSSSNSLMLYPRADKINSVLNYIESEYVDTVDREGIIENVIPSILENLDPHSIYIPARELTSFNEPLEGNFSGIGVQFNMQKDTVVIVSVIENGPSEKVGLLPGDRIVMVDDTLIGGVGMPSDQIVSRLKGPDGTKVRIGVRRGKPTELIDFEIIRGKIPIYSVDVAYMIDKDLGYIKISRFAKTTYDEFISAVIKLKSKGMKKVILDLRGNAGGLMDQASNIANEFLSEGQLIVYMEGKSRPRLNTYANKYGSCLEDEVVILMDEWSASSSEILAGALQDNDRATIIGRRSFGKGLVQNQIGFSDGSAMRLTIARYYTPTGRSIQKPYGNGTDDYYKDLTNRYRHGEFMEKDSIQLPDSLKYITPGGKIVYGGGGIMPDIFVPIDTVGITNYYNQISRRGLIYQFAFNFTDNYRDVLQQMNSVEEVEAYLDKQNVFKKFIQFAEEKGIKPNYAQINISEEILKTRIKASIAANVLDNDGFYPIIQRIDKTLQLGIENINK